MGSSFAQRSGLAAAALWCVAAPVWAADWQHEGGRETLRREFPVQSGQEVRLDLRWGALHVEPGDSGKVEVVVRAECHHHRRDCEDRVREIDIDGDSRRDVFAIELTGISKWHSNGVELDLETVDDLNTPYGSGRRPFRHILPVDAVQGVVFDAVVESCMHLNQAIE